MTILILLNSLGGYISTQSCSSQGTLVFEKLGKLICWERPAKTPGPHRILPP